MTTVFVAGALANKAGSGGEAWVRMSWVRGFQQLGFEVRFLEEWSTDALDTVAAEWFDQVVSMFGLEGRAALLHRGETVRGPALDELRDDAADAVLVNISGHLQTPKLMPAFRSRVMVDIDPGFTQFWHAQGVAGANVEGHDLHFTIGELIGKPACPIPTSGIEWLPVRQPVVLSDWPVVDDAQLDRFTTIANWRGPFGPVEFEGRSYGLKVHEFRKFIDLPSRSAQDFEIAVEIHPADITDRQALERSGWKLVDPQAAARSPDAFRSYVQASGAEFSVAQGVYVDTRCGWFSDRTVRYLVSGRPALVQDTGFSETLPTGDGLLAFRTLEEALAGADDIAARYPEHCDAARTIAEEYFDSDRLLSTFCNEAGIA